MTPSEFEAFIRRTSADNIHRYADHYSPDTGYHGAIDYPSPPLNNSQAHTVNPITAKFELTGSSGRHFEYSYAIDGKSMYTTPVRVHKPSSSLNSHASSMNNGRHVSDRHAETPASWQSSSSSTPSAPSASVSDNRMENAQGSADQTRRDERFHVPLNKTPSPIEDFYGVIANQSNSGPTLVVAHLVRSQTSATVRFRNGKLIFRRAAEGDVVKPYYVSTFDAAGKAACEAFRKQK